MAPFLQRSLGRGRAVPGRPRPLPALQAGDEHRRPLRRRPRRTPARRGGDDRGPPLSRAAGRRSPRTSRWPGSSTAGRRPECRSTTTPELDALVQWLPLDLELPALAEPPTRLIDELEAAGVSSATVDGDPALLAYKPRRRAVLRVGDARAQDLREAGGVRRRVRRPPGGRCGHARRRRGHCRRLVTCSLATPPARVDDVAQAGAAPGFTAGRLPAAPPGWRVARRESSSALRRVHTGERPRTGVPRRVAVRTQQLAAADASAELVAAILPDLGRPPARRCCASSRRRMPVDRRRSFRRTATSTRASCSSRRDGLAVVDFDAMSPRARGARSGDIRRLPRPRRPGRPRRGARGARGAARGVRRPSGRALVVLRHLHPPTVAGARSATSTSTGPSASRAWSPRPRRRSGCDRRPRGHRRRAASSSTS